jgi:hypothetical protein
MSRSVYANLVMLLVVATRSPVPAQAQQGESRVRSALPAVPSGRYSFLSEGPLEVESLRRHIEVLAYSSITMRRFGPPNLATLEEGHHSEITLDSMGELEYDGKSGATPRGRHRGTIDLFDYGRVCLLLECFLEPPQADTAFGIDAHVADPVVTEIVVREQDGTERKYRNDANFGDFRFWVLQSVIENIVSQAKLTPVSE